MDRQLQSGLEKRTRVGWTSRVYRLERGYLSAWSDVASAAALEDPTRVDCLFQGNQVATLSDQGDKRFKLEFPWDGAKTLQLRSNNAAMKDAWMSLLRATLQEAESQIRATGSVFAYGGTSKHEQDEAYEEAAYLKTNRFLAAYVVDEQSRASYVNDLLNEGFDHVGDRAGSGRDVTRACAGARAAITELLALTEDFKEEMKGLQELRQGKHDDGGLNSSVAAPKIQRFCEEHMSLVGRTISSRLMLELSPFMDSSVAGTSAAPTDSTRAELVATRQRLDEAYRATEQLVVLGTRAWFMDIRDYFLDCAGLEHATSAPPPPLPEAATQTADVDSPPPAPVAASPAEGPARRPSSKALFQVSSAFSAAKAVTKGGASKMGSSLSVKGRGSRQATTTAPAGALSEASLDSEPGGGGGGGAGALGGKLSSLPGVSMSIPRVFKRGSRTAAEKEEPSAALGSPSPPKPLSPRGVKPAKSAETEERERSDLFGGSSRSPSTSPRPNNYSAGGSRPSPRRSPFSPPNQAATGAVGGVGAAATESGPSAGPSEGPSGPVSANARSFQSAPPAGSGARKGKRAFAGGIWSGAGGGGGGGGGGASAPPAVAATDPPAERGEANGEAAGAVPAPAPPKPSGGKRRFAGGGFSGPPPPASSQPASAQVPLANPFGAGGGAGGSGYGGGGGGGGVDEGGSGKSILAWATDADAEEAVPAWAAAADDQASSGVSKAKGGRAGGAEPSNGFGLAPPSRSDQGRQVAAENSPFVKVDPVGPAARRPQQRRPGESGSRRAFGGGERLF